MTRRKVTASWKSLGIGTVFAVIVLLEVSAPQFASAGAYKCEDLFLDDLDEMQLRAAALRALPKAVHLAEVVPCRNPDSAHSWVSTKKVTSPEGVQQWYEFTCRRNVQPWNCDPPEFKQAITYSLKVGVVSRVIALSFDKEFSLSRARALSRKALEIYVDPTVRLAECELGGVRRPDLVDLRNGNLPAADAPTDVNVNHEGTAEAVWLRDVDVEIQFPPVIGNEGSSEELCWNDIILTA
jgi:hypothetical protein